MKIKKQGCVYFFKHKNISGVKIGYSNYNSPIKRFNQFKTYAPFGAIMLGFIETHKAKKLESTLHKKYSEKRMHGEWFNISTSEVDNIIKFYSGEEKLQLRSLLWEKYAKEIKIFEDIKENDINEDFSVFVDETIFTKEGYIKRTTLKKKYESRFNEKITPQEFYVKIRTYLNLKEIKFEEKKFRGDVIFDFR